MSRNGLIVLWILAILVLWILGWWVKHDDIEAELAEKTKTVLAEARIPIETVEFDNRTAILRGPAQSAQVFEAAEQKIREKEVPWEYQVFSVVNDLDAEAAPKFMGLPPNLNLSMDASSISLNGSLPTQGHVEDLYDAAVARFGAGNVENNLRVDGDYGDRPWLSRIPDLMNHMADNVSNPGIRVEGEEVTLNGDLVINGSVSTEEERSSVLSRAESLVEGLVSIKNNISVSRAQVALNQLLSNRIVEFLSGSSTITARGNALLDEVAAVLKENTEENILVAGHTDSDGDPAANMTLSQNRAAAVKAYLVRAGIAGDRLETEGFGETQPVRSNDTAAGKQKNRRVQFEVQ